MDEVPYNPLDKHNLGASVADALVVRPVHPLWSLESFEGAGIYAIYYTGNFKPYAPIALRNQQNIYSAPIYVGKAVPAGSRRGGLGLGIAPGQVLFSRLREHADSIQQATNLRIEDFRCRYLVVDDIWIPLGEAMMIANFLPVWNRVVDGFGNHDPGKGRYQQQRSPWDVLHPGRDWAERCVPCKKSKSELLDAIKVHFEIVFSSNEDAGSAI
jgi:hypothetical protein